jgi:hypothetical protein
MSEDIAFKIQLGVILPKMKEKLATEVTAIVEEIAGFANAGIRDGDQFEMEPVKEMIMKDFEIFLTDCILPGVEKKLSPPVEETADESASEESAEETEESSEE